MGNLALVNQQSLQSCGINLKTKELNKSKGVHTTSVSSLYVKDKIEIIDSPGVRDIEIQKFNPDEVLKGFLKLEKLHYLVSSKIVII